MLYSIYIHQENDAVVQTDYVNTPLIQVNASILRKDIEYETVPIDMSTTAQDVVSLLVNKYGTSNSMEEDYYLAEVRNKMLILLKCLCLCSSHELLFIFHVASSATSFTLKTMQKHTTICIYMYLTNHMLLL